MPTTPDWRFHSSGFIFSGRPDLTRIFTLAGIDWVSLANNHIKDYGSDGIRDTRRVLRRHGLAFGGAGKDLAEARRISYLDVADVRLAIVPCVDVAKAVWAAPGVSGATPCVDRYIVKDIKRARRQADVVIVFPHWGVEYTRQPSPSMRKHAARWVRAGADLILGAHSHVAGAIEDIDGIPALYSLGNLIFDQHWSTNTMESALLEATFAGPRLVSLRLHPYIVHAASQPNLLDPSTGEGRRLLQAVRKASADWLDW
jgi:poly-gamma-glutamate synthesis protein (capsule biosynthesis protein)